MFSNEKNTIIIDSLGKLMKHFFKSSMGEVKIRGA